MTGTARLVDALLAADVPALRALRDGLAEPALREVAAEALARLAPPELTDDDLRLLAVVSGHPGLSAAELAERVGPAFPAASARLRELGLVTSSRFERSDCWSRTAAGAEALRRAREAGGTLPS